MYSPSRGEDYTVHPLPTPLSPIPTHHFAWEAFKNQCSTYLILCNCILKKSVIEDVLFQIQSKSLLLCVAASKCYENDDNTIVCCPDWPWNGWQQGRHPDAKDRLSTGENPTHWALHYIIVLIYLEHFCISKKTVLCTVEAKVPQDFRGMQIILSRILNFPGYP